MSEHAELQAKILEWQRRWNIADGDPAMALIELLNIYGYRGGSVAPMVVAPPPSVEGVAVTAPVVSFAGMDEAMGEQIRSQLLPAIDRLGFQTQELRQKIEAMALENFAQQIATYHEGIDYCTKKLDVVKKDSDALVLQLGKVAGSINPITRMAVAVLVLIAFGLGFVAAVAFYR
jgi:hypothetical protein